MSDVAIESFPILETCPACASLMDVSNEPPFSQVLCPSCNQPLRVRRQFNNFELEELLGEGGMGSVFKALDTNLKRHVALKILRRECSANVEEYEKLAQEARLTASINHPHVVKVYSFGNDAGQFYLAMELVEKGSLDELMGIQKRVAEAQVLEVGIQIASGLQAALEVGLIHRDIKPGNILFADGHTAKLVDFGLALIMEEAASQRGEIWGTPYYIAPEKLDHQPEDFRSDMYSLGGTLFHAIAGRPPYEATTASMVALKQLKSLPISLQSFAPDVSSETAYVINRMLKKSPDDRYASYAELIEHLSYARQKLIERSQKPIQPKQREVVQSQAQKTAIGLIVLGLVLVMLAAGVSLFILRDQVADVFGFSRTKQVADPLAPKRQEGLNEARKLANAGKYREAGEIFTRLAQDAGIQRPEVDWIKLQAGLMQLLEGNIAGSQQAYLAQSRTEMFSVTAKDQKYANFFPESSRLMALPGPVAPGTLQVYAQDNYEAFAYLLYGLKNWQLGKFAESGDILRKFLSSEVSEEWKWIEEYRPLAQKFVDDFERFQPLQKALESVTPQTQADLLARVRTAKAQMQSGPVIQNWLKQIETQLSSP